jgi:putative ABC transport system permease protein
MSNPRDVDAELAAHVEMQVRRYIEAGVDPAEARRRTLARLGDLDAARRQCRRISGHMEQDMERSAWWAGLTHDLVHALRRLRRTPLFTVTALATMALGIGANVAIFSVVNAVLLKSVPYPGADRLVLVWNSYGPGPLAHASVSGPEFSDIRDEAHAFEGLAAFADQPSTLAGECAAGECEPERVTAYVVSSNIMDVLGAAPTLGRPFAPADGVAGAPKVIILSDALWRRRFGADPAIVGRTITVNAIPRNVIGVAPAAARFPDAPIAYMHNPADLWVPKNWEQAPPSDRGNQVLAVVARRRPGVSLAEVQADLDGIANRFRRAFPNRYARAGSRWHMEVVPLRDEIVGDVKLPLMILQGSVGLVLLIACANVANLMLARGTARRRELAVRSALGASRGRVARPLLLEASVVALAGALLGVGVAFVGIRGLVSLDPGNIPNLAAAGVDGGVLLFCAALTLATALIVGWLPALRYSRYSKTDPQSVLSDGSRGTDSAPARRRLRSLLVMGEVMMAAIVLVGAGLLVRSFAELSRVQTGFDPSETALAQVSLPAARYDATPKIAAFHGEMVGRLTALPGVIRASAAYPLPMSGQGWSGTLGVEDHPEVDGQPEPHAAYAVAMPNYFATLRIPLLDGRDFTAADDLRAPGVAIVDEALARFYWPGRSAIGRHIAQGGRPSDNQWLTIVGVVGHVRAAGPKAESEPQVYVPALQRDETTLYYIARIAHGDPAQLTSAMRAAVRSVDPALAVTALTTVPALTGRLVARDRLNMLLLATFGSVALALAAVGLYGVMACLVADRTREIGIRLALGGAPRRVLRAVIGEGLMLTGLGVGAGLVCAALLSHALTGLLFGVRPGDPATYAGIAALLLVVGVAASFVPARRAMRVDPVTALRN